MDQLTVMVYDASATAVSSSGAVTSAAVTSAAVTSTLAKDLANLRGDLR
jgi:hypothetical protein